MRWRRDKPPEVSIQDTALVSNDTSVNVLQVNASEFASILTERLAVDGIVQDEAELRAASSEMLWRSGAVAAAAIADATAQLHRLPRVDLLRAKVDEESFSKLSRRYLRDSALCPVDDDGTKLLAAADPGRTEAIEAVALALERRLPLVVASFEELDTLFDRAGEVEAHAQSAPTDVVEENKPLALSESIETLQDLARGAPVVRLLDRLLERAVELGATDIHLETEREQLRARLRVDGILRTEQTMAKTTAAALLSRVKILAGLDIAERRLPQDGRATVRVGSVDADVRVAIMPSMHGETAVLRILSRDARLLDLSRLGMNERDRGALVRLLKEPHGLAIVTGPTGSGKTTTLAAAIGTLNEPTRKIVTVEDPVELELPGVHQTLVRPAIGITFASALRSLLRHDPDVIMVGEMRDAETATIAIQAALTGHLVLTTLHTNSAADTVLRLADMGVERYLIAATLRGAIGQRLVRRLCHRCRRPKSSEGLLALAAAHGTTLPEDTVAYEAVGCETCARTGYAGRLGIFEVMMVEEELRTLVRAEPDPYAITTTAQESGMTTMLQDGLQKAAQGLTTLEEVLRAAG